MLKIKTIKCGSIPIIIQEEYEGREMDGSVSIGSYVWPSAHVLAMYLEMNQQIVNEKCVMELGAGTALPGLLSAKLGAKKVILTDKSMIDLMNAMTAIQLNGLTQVECATLLWGESINDTFDVILAADCFYNPQDFEDVIATMACAIQMNPHCVIYVAYQLRSVQYTIQPYLTRWGLQANWIQPDHANEYSNVFLIQIKSNHIH